MADEFGSSLRFVVKDPRICRFVPFWHRCLSEDGIEMRSVIIVRDPYEVASSLRARDGIGTEIALLLWLRHLLDAELSTRQMRRSIVSYPHLLCDAPRVLDRIGRDLETDWPVAPGIAAADLKTFLRPELRHHSRAPSTTGGAAPVASWVEQVVAAFDDLASMERSHDGTALRTLDAVKQDLDRAAAAFGIPDELIRDADRVSLTDARPDLDELRSQVAALSADRERIDRHARVLEAERANVHEQLTLMHAECERLRAHLCGVLASGSWRVTAPLRLALRTARALSAVGQRRHVRPTG